jgi:hypothetical protein
VKISTTPTTVPFVDFPFTYFALLLGLFIHMSPIQPREAIEMLSGSPAVSNEDLQFALFHSYHYLISLLLIAPFPGFF